jgi:16S rRNA (guanine527-N7)-methyltransferase
MEQDYLKQLKLGCNKLELAVTDEQYSKLYEYVCLLLKWNKVYNLTSITKHDEIIVKHILDSLSIIKYITDSRVIDVGSGAGLPGIVIAILQPDVKVKLLDSNSKKTAFLQQVKIELKLNNAEIITKRIQDYKPDNHFKIIISRAFASITDFVNMTQHLLADNGKVLAMKGKILHTEITEFDNSYKDSKFKILDIYKLDVPFLNEDRHLIQIIKN